MSTFSDTLPLSGRTAWNSRLKSEGSKSKSLEFYLRSIEQVLRNRVRWLSILHRKTKANYPAAYRIRRLTKVKNNEFCWNRKTKTRSRGRVEGVLYYKCSKVIKVADPDTLGIVAYARVAALVLDEDMPAKSISFASTTVSRASAKSETTIAFGPVVSLSPSFASTTSAKPGTTTVAGEETAN
ncbi:hypothetical protein BGX33_008184 [Mortierella sp. NVP41]|nr:hypothetical protein BGX33_008184 [Mortierella sp. NVP41]